MFYLDDDGVFFYSGVKFGLLSRRHCISSLMYNVAVIADYNHSTDDQDLCWAECTTSHFCV